MPSKESLTVERILAGCLVFFVDGCITGFTGAGIAGFVTGDPKVALSVGLGVTLVSGLTSLNRYLKSIQSLFTIEETTTTTTTTVEASAKVDSKP